MQVLNLHYGCFWLRIQLFFSCDHFRAFSWDTWFPPMCSDVRCICKQMADVRCSICTEREVRVIDIIHVGFGDRYQVCSKIKFLLNTAFELRDFMIVKSNIRTR